MLQQDGNTVADGIHALALIALEALFTTQHQWLAADRAGKDLQQVRRYHMIAILAKRLYGAALNLSQGSLAR